MLIKRPGPEEQALWRAYADLIDKYQVGPAIAKEKQLRVWAKLMISDRLGKQDKTRNETTT